MLDSAPEPTLAAESCCQLINAYLKDPEQVDWEDVQQALDTALKALNLPPIYIEEASYAVESPPDRRVAAPALASSQGGRFPLDPTGCEEASMLRGGPNPLLSSSPPHPGDPHNCGEEFYSRHQYAIIREGVRES